MLKTINENSQDQNKEVEVEPRRSKKAMIEKYFGLDFLTYILEGKPQTFKEAMNCTESLMWKEAFKMDLRPGCKPLSSKWSIYKYKARLVIKGYRQIEGYRQTEGLDYFNTYSLVKKINSIPMVLTIATLRNLEVHQIDVKTTFLNGDLDEEIYIEQPKDNMLIVGNDDKMITSTKTMLNSRFDMKDMRLVDVILGIKIIRTSDGLILSQSHYVDNILGKFDKDNFGVGRTPVDVTLYLSKNKGESVCQIDYSRVISSLMYLMSCMRLNIAYAVSKLRIIRILKYLQFTRDYGLHYTRYLVVLEGYNGANWISNVKDSTYTSGYVFTLGDATVSWKSSKQMVIARSTMEYEFVTLDKHGKEVEWLHHFLEDITRWPKQVPPICMHCDSQSSTEQYV
ncbi:hypothetical protein AAG906_039556 [Vitis piasezkii]